MNPSPPAQLFRDLGAFDSCTIANAVDSFRVRLLNEGFTGPGITCRTKALPPMVGVAFTMKVRSSEPSMKPAFYLEQPDWWEKLENAPYPRVLMIEDTDAHPGRGSLVGPVHACIIKALGFVGVVTTGAIRGSRKFAEIGMHAFSQNVSPSHAFCHVVEMGGPIEIAGVRIKTGEIIHGDHDGIVSIPADLAGRIPDAARRVVERERVICEYCASRGFSREKLRGVINPDTSRW
jgi:4-hydroxy-4-methyl-2-oxoglutarate aldolase